MITYDPVFETYDYAIGGKLVVGKTVLTDDYQQLVFTDQAARMRVKKELVHQLAEYMLDKDPVLFHTHVAIRAYIAPDDQVRILRLANKVV